MHVVIVGSFSTNIPVVKLKYASKMKDKHLIHFVTNMESKSIICLVLSKHQL